MAWKAILLAFVAIQLNSMVNAQTTLIDLKKVPKALTADMCKCAASILEEDRENRRKTSRDSCKGKLSLADMPDIDKEVQDEIAKKLPRGLSNWAGKQVETEGVDYTCIDHLREIYYRDNKLKQYLKSKGDKTHDDYDICFGQGLKWLNTKGELDKVFIKGEINSMQKLDPKVRQSMELLSLTCKGKNHDDLEPYLRCSMKPCFDPAFFETVKV